MCLCPNMDHTQSDVSLRKKTWYGWQPNMKEPTFSLHDDQRSLRYRDALKMAALRCRTAGSEEHGAARAWRMT